MMKYVAGFLLRGPQVYLVCKTHPNWQKGLLNGIGGHVEDRETYQNAMRREFVEETGLDVTDWQPFAVERGPGYACMFFRKRLEQSFAWPELITNDKHEELVWRDTSSLNRLEIIGNLQWLIPMALDPRPIMAEVTTTGSIKDEPTWGW